MFQKFHLQLKVERGSDGTLRTNDIVHKQPGNKDKSGYLAPVLGQASGSASAFGGRRGRC